MLHSLANGAEAKVLYGGSQAKGAARIGLPAYSWWNEALHGVALSPGVSFETNETMFSYATSFANPILMSAAFDDDLIFNVADTVSTEARAFSNAGHAGLDFWTPNINPFKDPRWGRGTEVCIGRLLSMNKGVK